MSEGRQLEGRLSTQLKGKREWDLLAACFVPQRKGIRLSAPLPLTPMVGTCPLLNMSHSPLRVQSPTPSPLTVSISSTPVPLPQEAFHDLSAKRRLNSHDALLAPLLCLFSPIDNWPPGGRDFHPLLNQSLSRPFEYSKLGDYQING